MTCIRRRRRSLDSRGPGAAALSPAATRLAPPLPDGPLPLALLRGDQLRSYYRLRLLAPRHRTTLVSFRDVPIPEEGARRGFGLLRAVRDRALGRAAMGLGLARGTFSPLPFQVSLSHPGPRPGRRLATQARRFVESRYTWERSTEHLEELHEAARTRR